MKYKSFAVYDGLAEVFSHPFHTFNKATAIRGFTEQVNNPESQFAKHPTDFSLHEVGEFDDKNGMMTPLTAPLRVGLASEFLREQR